MNRWILISYILFLVIFTGFSYLFIDGNLPYLHMLFTDFAFQNRKTTTLLYILSLIVFFGFYFYFIRAMRQGKLSFQDVKRLILVSVGILFFAYPTMLSYDIFNYIATAKVAYFYHENPYVVMPVEFIGDPLLLFTHAANKIALYGPTWLLFSVLPYLLGFGNFVLTLFLFKLSAALSFLGVLVMYYKLHKNDVSLILFALNPLVLTETMVSGHNDMFMMFFILLGLLLLQKNKLTAWIVFIASIGIKYATIFLLPVFLASSTMSQFTLKKMFLWSAILMFLIFLLSPIREEMYPWYAVWFLPFVFSSGKPFWITAVIGLSFGLLLRYVPFMLWGTYSDPTPQVKALVTVVPLVISSIYYLVWLKKSSHFLS